MFILLEGQVASFVSNFSQVNNWNWAIDIYNSLRKWKKNIFDKKIRVIMRQQFEQEKIKFELDLNRRIRARFRRLKSFKDNGT